MFQSLAFLLPALLVAGPAVVVVTALLGRKGEFRQANRVLAGVIVLLAALCAEQALVVLRGGLWARVQPWFPPLGFLVAPGIYLYARTLLGNGVPRSGGDLSRRDLVHALPFVLAYGATAAWAFSMGTPLRVLPPPDVGRWFVLANAVLSGGYLAASWVHYLRRGRPRSDRGSPLVRLEDQWLRYLLWLFSLLWLSLALLFPAKFDATMTLGLYLAMAAFVVAIAAFGLRWSALFLPAESVRALAKPTGPPRYATSGLSAEEVSRHSRDLLAHLEGSRCFLESDLKIEDLARALRLTEYQLSQVLNVGLGENFFSLVARYRIDEAKRLLGEPPAAGGNILDVAYRVGFNSKSTFNTAFKKLVGVTPSAYRKRQELP